MKQAPENKGKFPAENKSADQAGKPEKKSDEKEQENK